MADDDLRERLAAYGAAKREAAEKIAEALSVLEDKFSVDVPMETVREAESLIVTLEKIAEDVENILNGGTGFEEG